MTDLADQTRLLQHKLTRWQDYFWMMTAAALAELVWIVVLLLALYSKHSTEP